MKSVALTPVLLACFLAACGKSETAASASQPEGKPDAPVASQAPRPKEATNVPLEQYVEVSNGIYSFTPEQGFEVIAFNAAISQVDPKLPPDFDLLARLSSKDYDRTQDAFKKRELLATLQPKLEERIAHFQASPYVATVYAYKNNIEEYDFTRNAFPINVFKGDNSLFAGNGVLLDYRLNNKAAVSFFPVADEALAQRIEMLRTSGKTPRLKAYFVADRKPTNSNASAFNHYFTDDIPLTVTHLQLVDRDGTVLADYAPDQSSTPQPSSEVQANAASIIDDF